MTILVCIGVHKNWKKSIAHSQGNRRLQLMSQWEIKISSLFPILAFFFFFRVSFAQSTGVGKWQDNNCYFCHHRLTDKLFLSTSDNSPSYYPHAQLHHNAVINSNGQHWNYLWWAACTQPTGCIGTTLMDSLYPSTSDIYFHLLFYPLLVKWVAALKILLHRFYCWS